MGQDITTALAVATGRLRSGSSTGCSTAGRCWTRAGSDDIGKNAKATYMASSGGFHLVLVLVPPPQACLREPYSDQGLQPPLTT